MQLMVTSVSVTTTVKMIVLRMARPIGGTVASFNSIERYKNAKFLSVKAPVPTSKKACLKKVK